MAGLALLVICIAKLMRSDSPHAMALLVMLQIWIMDPPYDVFRNRYPFLCGDVQFDELVPMPHRITSSIFMGSRPFKVTLAESVRWLHELSITHVIVNTEQPLASQEGLAVLR